MPFPALLAAVGLFVAEEAAAAEISATLIMLAFRYYPVIAEIELLLSENIAPAVARAQITAQLARSDLSKVAKAREAFDRMLLTLAGVPESYKIKIQKVLLDYLQTYKHRGWDFLGSVAHEGQKHVAKPRRPGLPVRAQGSRAASQQNLNRLRKSKGLVGEIYTDTWTRAHNGHFWRQADNGIPIEAVRKLEAAQVRQVNAAAEKVAGAQRTVLAANKGLADKFEAKGVTEHIFINANGEMVLVFEAPGAQTVSHVIGKPGATPPFGPIQYTQAARQFASLWR